jgi:ribosomal protein S18 acetylase RimI-like enzyme
LVRELLAADAPAAPALDRNGMLALDHFRDRGVSTSDPWADAAIGYPVQFTHHPAARVTAPPSVDEHHGASFGAVDVRALRPADLVAAERVVDHALGSRHQARLDEVHDVLSYDGFGAWMGEELVGVVMYSDEELVAIGVEAEHRGTGVAAQLVDAVVQAFTVAGRPTVWLVTTNDNLDAIRLYQRHGFRLTEVRPGAVDEVRRTLKPQIPVMGGHGIELHDELVFTRDL